jgi:hypothetical protein
LGSVTRTIVGNHSVFVPTDPLGLDVFSEVETSIRAVLEDFGEWARSKGGADLLRDAGVNHVKTVAHRGLVALGLARAATFLVRIPP